MYFEIYKTTSYKKGDLYTNKELVKVGNDVLKPFTIQVSLMDVPTTNITLPIDYLKYINGREEIKVYWADKCFYGYVSDYNINGDTLDIELTHIIGEWENRQISMNNAIKDKSISFIYVNNSTDLINDTLTGESISTHDTEIQDELSFLNLSTEELIKYTATKAWDNATSKFVDVSILKTEYYQDNNTINGIIVTWTTQKGTKIDTQIKFTNQTNLRNSQELDTTIAYINNKYIDYDRYVSLSDSDLCKEVCLRAYKTSNSSIAYETTLSNREIEINTDGKPYQAKYRLSANGFSLNAYIVFEITKETPDPAIDEDARVVDQLEDIMTNINFSMQNWDVVFDEESRNKGIDYVYSRMSKLEALSKSCNLTKDVYWRVGLTDKKQVEIGVFGKDTNYTISTRPSGENNIELLSELAIDNDFNKVINMASVYSNKGDGGASTLTLREVFEDKSLQDSNFPVYIIRTAESCNVNNERNYTEYLSQFPALAPNNDYEYAILDIEGIALESGEIIEGSFAFNDLGAFNVDNRKTKATLEITDEDRIKQALIVYQAGIRKLKELRRSYTISGNTADIPNHINVGDRVHLSYDIRIFDFACKRWKKLIKTSDLYYINEITYNVSRETNTCDVVLTKFLKGDRDV